jgi:hypothetical protein
MPNVVINIVRDIHIYRSGRLPVLGVEAEFMVGEFGPFTVKTEKTDNWDADLKRLISDQENRVRSLQA